VSEWIHIQYKATHPLWGMRSMPGEFGKWKGSTEPKPITDDVIQALHQDFRVRVGIPLPLWNTLLELEMVRVDADTQLGVDSYIVVKAGGTFPGGEFEGLTLREVLRGLDVKLALEAWQK
jgi:hypothetical protein